MKWVGGVRRQFVISAVTFLVVSAAFAPMPAQAQAACANVAYEGSITLPLGAAVRRVIRLDSQCRPLITRNEVVNAAQLEAILRWEQARLGQGQVREQVTARRASSNGRIGLARPLEMVAGGPIHMFNRVKDALGMNVTSIDPHNFSYGYNGSTITSTTHDSSIWRSTESGTCGPGWSVVWANTGISISGGGVGSSFADSLTHAEFSYLGAFDCSGGTYYNTLDTKLTGYGNGGSSTCAYRTQLRNTFYGWYQELLCWDAYVWTTPPSF